VYTVLLPISAAAVGVGVLGEAFSGAHVVAMGFALAGLLLATWPEG
jgi:drug/metabolite transporter (DMT)-like permease